MNIKRHYHKWSVNEILNLQREYELLGMNINNIAKKHERTEEAILWRLEEEGFVLKDKFPVERMYNLRSNTKLIKEEVENFIKQKRLQHIEKNKKPTIEKKNQKYI